MTPSTLCIARSFRNRTIGFESTGVCIHICCSVLSISRSSLLRLVLSRHREGDFYFIHRARSAAQLTVAPDKTPDAAPAGRAGSICARRTASRRLQMLQRVPAAVVAASGAPLVRSPVDASCG